MLRFAVLVFLAIASLPVFSQVNIQEKGDRIDIQVDGKPFTSLFKGGEANKPYFYPLRTASGVALTRGFPMETISGESTDHPHQRSLWIGAEHIDGMDFWEIEPSYERAHKGKIEYRRVLSQHNGKSKGDLTILAQWVSPTNEILLDETLKVTFYAGSKENRTMDIDLSLKSLKKVTFGDDHDAILGLRLTTPFEESHGGKIVNADGAAGADHIRGSHSRWVDWSAEVGGENVGIAMMDSPKNFRYPTPWHVRPYGMLFASPFAQHDFNKSLPDGSLTLEPGQVLHLRYRILIHPAGFPVEKSFQEFAAQ